jgi:NADH:ubiquinone oxidoreductase subunit 5 (subunit L)/multisubunit Na+/H+ antiporter MnhA subunit
MLTLYGGEQNCLKDASLVNKQQYCLRHGCALYVPGSLAASPRAREYATAHYTKILAVEYALRHEALQHEWVVWTDADAIFFNMSISPAEALTWALGNAIPGSATHAGPIPGVPFPASKPLSPDAAASVDLILTWPLNTGCFFVRNSAAALALLLWALASGASLPADWRVSWIPALGIDLAFRLDGLSALMLLLITGIGTGVFVYAGGYLAGHPHQRRLYGALTAFMLAMIGCVLADDLFVLFLFWEMTSLTSFLLVGFNHHDQQSRKSAQQALLVTGSGGLAMFAGFVLLAQAFGTSSISVIIAAAPAAEATPVLTAAVALVLVGAFTKSAQVPFHFWLPNAMAAPTPVSAYLHSATMVKLGVYLVARLDPAFGAWPWWQWTLQAVGALTAGWAMVLALRERDLKRILAWSTVATLGTLVLLVGLPGAGATAAVAALLLAHALYKAPLFFVAGNVDHEAGTRIIDRLGNLRRAMPWTATAALLAGLSMAGIPLTFGFVAKDAIHSAKAAEELLPLVQMATPSSARSPSPSQASPPCASSGATAA